MKPHFEKVVPGDGRAFSAFEDWSDGFNSSYHFHPELELTAILAGNGHRIIGDHIETFNTGDLVLIGENLPHHYVSPHASSRSPKWAGCVVLQFLSGVLGGSLLDAPELGAVATLLRKARRGLAFRGPRVQSVAAEMRKVAATHGPARIIGLLQILHKLAEIPSPRPLASSGYLPSLDTRYASRVTRACELIQRRFDEPVTQAEVAAHVAMSPPAFSRLFQSSTRLTFTAFLTGIRLSEACRRLLETDETISEICYRCGFANLSNFNRRFLSAKGMTPREFRSRATALARR